MRTLVLFATLAAFSGVPATAQTDLVMKDGIRACLDHFRTLGAVTSMRASPEMLESVKINPKEFAYDVTVTSHGQSHHYLVFPVEASGPDGQCTSITLYEG